MMNTCRTSKSTCHDEAFDAYPVKRLGYGRKAYDHHRRHASSSREFTRLGLRGHNAELTQSNVLYILRKAGNRMYSFSHSWENSSFLVGEIEATPLLSPKTRRVTRRNCS